jgi:lysophospholipase L1-like esterase
MTADTARLGDFVVIWAGRNNFWLPTTVLEDVATMVAALPAPKKYVVLSVLNSALTNEGYGQASYTTITALNASLAAAYPANYIDIRTLLAAQYNPSLPQDVFDHGNDIPPASLRAQDGSGTLAGTIADTSTCSISLNVTGMVVNGSTITVDAEKIFLSAISGGSVTGCTRGYASTTPATHANGTAYTALDSIHLNTAGYQYVGGRVAAWLVTHN